MSEPKAEHPALAAVSDDRRGRLFVAVRPPPEVLDVIASLPRRQQAGVRWTTRDQWHVTLRFLGICSVAAAIDAMSKVEAMSTTASLGPRVGRLGRGVLMVPVLGLEALAAAVVSAMACVGQPPDDRPFLGHLTLARLRGAGACALTSATVSASWPVTTVQLVESHLGRDGARYETIYELPLRPAVP